MYHSKTKSLKTEIGIFESEAGCDLSPNNSKASFNKTGIETVPGCDLSPNNSKASSNKTGIETDCRRRITFFGEIIFESKVPYRRDLNTCFLPRCVVQR